VIHAAGVLTAEPLAQLDPDSVQAVLHPKVGGAWVLHMLTRERSLDWLVLFSSGASVWGSVGFGHYAAANHFLDTLAHFRRLSGLPAVTINWGWWTGEGLAAAGEALFRQSGLAAMSPSEALGELEQAIASGAIQETVAAVDWGVFKPIYEAKRRRPLLDEVTVDAVPPDQEQASSGGRLVGLLQRLPAGERLERLRQHVAEEVAQILGFDSPDAVDPRKGFFKLGMDSMLTVQFRNRLEASLGRPLPSTVAFEYPTVDAMSDYLLHVVLAAELGAAAAATVRPAAEITPVPAPGDDLSEEELTALLAEKLRGKR
jgi:acyl carrier protein